MSVKKYPACMETLSRVRSQELSSALASLKAIESWDELKPIGSGRFFHTLKFTHSELMGFYIRSQIRIRHLFQIVVEYR